MTEKVGHLPGPVSPTTESARGGNATDRPPSRHFLSLRALELGQSLRLVWSTLSKLGIDQFDGSDLRLLEVLASHAAVAFENARLFQTERESAEVSGSLLALSQALTLAADADAIWSVVIATIPGLIRSAAVDAWVADLRRRTQVTVLYQAR